MPTIRQIVFGLVVAIGILLPGHLLAGSRSRRAVPHRDMLRNEGFTGWGTIALDDGDDVLGDR
jgi:hypothetical protein